HAVEARNRNFARRQTCRAGADGGRVGGTPGERVNLDPLLVLRLGRLAINRINLDVGIKRHGRLTPSLVKIISIKTAVAVTGKPGHVKIKRPATAHLSAGGRGRTA